MENFLIINRATRAFGTLAAGCCFHWRAYYWPQRFGYAWTPYGVFLLGASHILDFIYPFVFAYVKRHEAIPASGPSTHTGGIENLEGKKSHKEL